MKKKVVTQIENDALIAIGDTYDNGNIYAFWSKCDNYSIVVRSNDDGYYTNWLYADQMQEEYYGPYSSLHKILKAILEDGHEVFEFHDELEFIEWIREMNHSLSN